MMLARLVRAFLRLCNRRSRLPEIDRIAHRGRKYGRKLSWIRNGSVGPGNQKSSIAFHPANGSVVLQLFLQSMMRGLPIFQRQIMFTLRQSPPGRNSANHVTHMAAPKQACHANPVQMHFLIRTHVLAQPDPCTGPWH
jgi:hypothetical protein